MRVLGFDARIVYVDGGWLFRPHVRAAYRISTEHGVIDGMTDRFDTDAEAFDAVRAFVGEIERAEQGEPVVRP